MTKQKILRDPNEFFDPNVKLINVGRSDMKLVGFEVDKC
jgi:hypothetical protein